MRSAIVLAAMTLAGAQAFASDPAVTVCEAALKATLKAPKTYERVSADLTGRSVYLTYDAVNSFNVPLRGKHKCDFAASGGHYSFPFDANASESALVAESAAEGAAMATGLYPIPAASTSLR